MVTRRRVAADIARLRSTDDCSASCERNKEACRPSRTALMQETLELFEPLNDETLTHEGEHLEQSWTHRCPSHRNTCGVYERAGLHTSRLSGIAQCLFGVGLIEGRQGVQRLAQRADLLVEPGRSEMLCDRRGIVCDAI